jgi:hypothetical protein
MTRDDALVLLDVMHLDRDPPPPLDVEKMARLFAHAISRTERKRPDSHRQISAPSHTEARQRARRGRRTN